MQAFTAVIESNAKGGMFVRVPFDVEAIFGQKRPKIKATFDGAPYRGLLTKMGTPYHILLVRSDIRKVINKSNGDEVSITVELDTEPRVVVVPNDLQKLLDANAAANAQYDKLSYTHRKEFVNWINDAKREATRERRLAKTIEMLIAGKTR